VLSWVITDDDATYVTELRNGALHHRTVAAPLPGTTTFALTRPALIGLITGTLDLATALTEAPSPSTATQPTCEAWSRCSPPSIPTSPSSHPEWRTHRGGALQLVFCDLSTSTASDQ
jgi:hypothetical protein